jgi:CPA2 family monovalent cation:H+ antiporter-2
VPHSTLIATLAAAFVLAFALGFIAAKLRMPPLVGYLVAGVLIGPHTPGFVADSALASDLAEVGVILLMFGVGLHFSVKDLLAVRRIAIPGAVAQILLVTLIGAALARYWGWHLRAGLVFGLSLSVASTVVLLRVLEERNGLNTPEGRIAIGWLIVQDLIAVLALVFLPALADSAVNSPPGAGTSFGFEARLLAVTLTLGKVALFVALALIVGVRVVPWMLTQVVRTGSRELFTLAVLAVALGIAWGSSTLFGVSLALGAFFAGVILSESPLSHKAGEDSLPLQDAFAVLFFVSVGMLFNPTILTRAPVEVLAVLLVIFVGNPLVAFIIVLLFRCPLRTALTVSASLAQTGEFSFILAGLGASLGVLPPRGRDLILAGSLLSITLNPLAFAGIPAIHRALSSRLRLMEWLERMPAPRLESSAGQGQAPDLNDHAIIIGHGRVGGALSPILEREGLPFVVIERDRELIEALKQRSIPSVFGDATARGVLEAARVEAARVLIVALPDSFQVRRVLEIAHHLNPRIDTVARTHSESELRYLQAKGVGLVVMGELAIARGMTEYVLHGFGVPPARAQFLAQQDSDREVQAKSDRR